MAPPKTFADQLIAYTRESAQKNGIDAQWLLDNAIHGYEDEPDKRNHKLMQFIREAAKHKGSQDNQTSLLNATKFLAADRIVLNAIGNMYRAVITPSPKERITAYFEGGLSGTGDEQDAFIDVLETASKKMIISIVQTMHPTIYHSKFAREQETKLTGKLEAMSETLKTKTRNKLGPVDEADPLFQEAKGIIDEMMKSVAAGEAVTPHKRVAQAAENRLDRENHRKMRKAFEGVVDIYNQMLLTTADALEREEKLAPAPAARLRACVLDKKKIAQWRTWAFGADADGRNLATSIVFYDGIHGHVRNGEFLGRKRDARENAKEHKDAVSSIIQRAYRKIPDFRTFCQSYMAEQDDRAQRGEIQGERIDWKSPGESTLLQLREAEQVEFMRRLIIEGYGAQGNRDAVPNALRDIHLIPGSLKEETIAFNQMFHDLYPAFLEANGLLPDTELDSLDGAMRKKLADAVKKRLLEVHGELIEFKLDEQNLVYSPATGDNQNFFKPTLKTKFKEVREGAERKLHATNSEMDDRERRKTLDVVKRLQVLDNAIEKYSPAVADRYQIANFEKASDFYAALLLFKETGVVQIKDGEVTGTPKLSIQPLLETEQDQKNAIGMFRELLKDPLVKSYYQALGNRADIMVGYSDGAKSAGNFASEWSVYKCIRELKKVFADDGINLRVFHGRGRGDSRGGQYEEGQAPRLLPQELQEDITFDETIQSDGPLNGAISEFRGKDTMAGILLGTITAACEAKELKKNSTRKEWLKSVEGAIDKIAEVSKETYCALVKDNPNTLALLSVAHDNDNKASRPPKRGKSDSLDDVRAIPVENGFNMADSALHYVGLKKALTKFIADAGKIRDIEGRELTGNEALWQLYDSHPFFRGMLDKTERGLIDFDPDVFRKYAKVAGDGVPEWAELCINELIEARNMVQAIRTKQFARDNLRRQWNISQEVGVVLPEHVLSFRQSHAQEPYEQHALVYNLGPEFAALREKEVSSDKMAHGVALAFALENGEVQSIETLKKIRKIDETGAFSPLRPDPEKYPVTAELMENLSFVVMESNRNRGLITPPAIRAAVDHAKFVVR